MKEKLTYISLFSSAGIGCYGFKLENFHCIATNELLEKRLEIQKYNKKCLYETGYISGSITEPSVKEKLFGEIKLWNEKHKIKSPDVLIATPPCQGMSVANHKKKDERGRNSLVVESIKLTQETSPKFFIFENVRAFMTTLCTDSDGEEKTIKDAIYQNLGGIYNIHAGVINFKDYGANSSRTRTLVVGVRKDLKNLSPFDIFPTRKKGKTLKELIGHLPALKKMGEISQDIFHAYREFDERMLPWIENLSEGQSAFDNTDPLRIPHKTVNGKLILNKSKNGDKYARWYWDRIGPCIHTRNDILASQNTIHPADNRVFSIRELMLMMSIPPTFRWSEISLELLNKKSLEEKQVFLKKEELKIRQCLGEAVPTAVFRSIAKNIKTSVNKGEFKVTEIQKLIKEYSLEETGNLIHFINTKFDTYELEQLFLIAELANSKRLDTAAYFTRKDIAFTVVKNLPDLKGKKKIKILEPSVGVGNFLPLLFEKYSNKAEVELHVCDIDPNSLKILNALLQKIKVPSNFNIRMINEDFLRWKNNEHYDIVVGNPPYKKLSKNAELLREYRDNVYNSDTNNLFSFFIEKSLKISNHVSLIVPKSLLNAPEFNKTRDLLASKDLKHIIDFGEKAFKGVKIETIGFSIGTKFKNKTSHVTIESYITNSYFLKPKNYIITPDYPYWLIYRDSTFDEIASKMKLDIFQSFRDRQITKKVTIKEGKIRVLKSRNIGNNEVKNLDGYDCYVNSYEKFAVSKFLNQENIVIIPNLTYYPRASFLPKKSIADGSVALLTLKNGSRLPTEKDLKFYSSKDFTKYYKIARNYGTRSLNIDNNSVFFFGLLKELS